LKFYLFNPSYKLVFFIGLIYNSSFIIHHSQAQDLYSISGKVIDAKPKTGLPGAACVLMKGRDSVIVKGIQTNADGSFVFSELEKGFYRIKIQYLGFETVTKRVRLFEGNIDLGSIELAETATNLKEVNVIGKIPPVIQKGDTTQFNASGFKTNTDASAEDLVTKMPGVTVQDGKVNAQGEEVRKVLIDNKPFFGDDPSNALKSLPADMIDKVQIFDQMSEQSRFTGFNDGNTTKTMNIITKGGMRNGNFGKAYLGGGTDDRFKSGLTFNRFSGSRRMTVLGQANNINEQNFSMSDLAGAMGSGGGGGRRGGGGMGMGGMGGVRNGGFNQAAQDFFVNSKKGVVNTKAAGINFSDNLGKKGEFTGNYFFNQSNNQAIQNSYRTFAVSKDSGQVYTETNSSETENLNHRFNLRVDYKLDSNNSILYTPRFTYQEVRSTSNVLGANSVRENQLNSTSNLYDSKFKAYNMNNEILFRHKFKKAGRTISLNSNLGNNGNNGGFTQNSDNSFFGKINRRDTLRQQTDTKKTGWSIQNTLTYTEPISTKSQLSLTYGFNYAKSESERLTYKKNIQTGIQENLDTLLSNKFKSETPAHSAGLGYAFNSEKSNLNLTVNAQQSMLQNEREFPKIGNINRTFQNILPTLVWRYSISKATNFRLIYRTSANAPSIDQLQDVVNNNNPLQLSTGNSGLRQDYQHNAFFRLMNTNEKTNASFFAMVGGSATRHFIGNSTLIAQRDTLAEGVLVNRGAQLTRPVNLPGYVSVRTFLMYSMPVTKLKTNVNLNANANFVRTPGQVNGKINYANSPTFGAGLGLTSNISKAVDFNLSYNASYTSVENSLIGNQNNSYLNQIIGAKVNLVFWESLVLNTDYSQNLFSGLAEGINTNFAILNLGLGYKFLKGKPAELRLTVFDLLEQNTNVSRTITETYTEDVRSNNLQRYFMLTFTYTLRAFKAPEPEGMEKFRQMGPMRPGVGPPGGYPGH
jgi:hypothetical protein